MAISKLPADLPERLRKAGLKVVVLDGWRTRGRPGAFAPVGVLWHHTGSFDGMNDATDDKKYARWLGVVGRSDLPAPLSQLSISAEGVVYVLAAGRANHAGKAKASGSVAAGDGNKLYVGVECMNSGSQGWSKAQYNAMVKTAVVLGRVVGCTPKAQRGHKETSVTGKWDPGKLDMAKFRTDIGVAAKPAPKPPAKAPAKPAPKPVVRALNPTRTYVVTAASLHGRRDPRLAGTGVGKTLKKGQRFEGNAVADDAASKRTFVRERGTDLWYDTLHLDRVVLPEVSLSTVTNQAAAKKKTVRAGVVRLQRALIAKGLLAKGRDGGKYDARTKAAYKAWQKKLGYTGKDADGVPGEVSLQKLGAGRFRVVK